jgi:uncharacterized protein (DUF1810 family)
MSDVVISLHTGPEILGRHDDLKFCSSMTLFSSVSHDPEFAEAIAKYYGDFSDRRTLDLLSAPRGASIAA